jgi:hypothetical protein
MAVCFGFKVITFPELQKRELAWRIKKETKKGYHFLTVPPIGAASKQ